MENKAKNYMEREKIELERLHGVDNIYYKVFVNGAWLMNLYQTCVACPEQYELKSLLDGEQLAYIRLRWSYFSCEYKDCGEEIIYEAYIDDSGWSGEFESEEQRIEHLTKAISKVIEKIRSCNNTSNEGY